MIKSNEDPVCPLCRGKLEKHDWVKRVKKMPGGRKEWRYIEVRKCTNDGCHKKHRLIPDDHVPYKHYEEKLIEKVIKDELTEEELLEAEDYPCDETRKRWKTWAEQLKKNAEAHMRLLLIKLLKMSELLYLEDISLLNGISSWRYFNDFCDCTGLFLFADTCWSC